MFGVACLVSRDVAYVVTVTKLLRLNSVDDLIEVSVALLKRVFEDCAYISIEVCYTFQHWD